MGFALPLAGSAARNAIGDIAHAVDILSPANSHLLPSTIAAVKAAQRTLAGCPAGTRVNVIVLRGDDERWLISVGPRGGWRKIWNFGTGH